MLKSLHLNSVKYLNLRTSFRLAHECGFGAVEISVPKLLNFLNIGNTAADVRAMLDEFSLTPVCVNDIFGVESMRPEERARIFKEMELLAPLTQAIGCKTLQVCPLTELSELSWPEARRMTAKNIRTLADMAAPYGVRIQLETMAWAPIHSLALGLEVLDEVGRDNTGISIDTWHFYAGGETSPDDVAKMDKAQMCNIHFCDGRRPHAGEAWDEEVQRAYYPGEGDIPLKEYADAIRATGYDGPWSIELISRKHWEEDSRVVAQTLYRGLSDYCE
ncbi:sugar phosphate isomerase/epimerase [Christensenellaceae bacterium OttesenSCG-928-L17]|nr:sugar phosphate isomerase/epimerase [Christensenellaceae bacterium OttesenSCG-928-L17]